MRALVVSCPIEHDVLAAPLERVDGDAVDREPVLKLDIGVCEVNEIELARLGRQRLVEATVDASHVAVRGARESGVPRVAELVPGDELRRVDRVHDAFRADRARKELGQVAAPGAELGHAHPRPEVEKGE
jgi:hypothetical protein